MSDDQHDDESVVRMRVGGIVVDPRSQVPVVVLRGIAEPRLYLPIFIGGLEATAIATVLAEVELPRPMTHDLIVAMLRAVGSTLERITVTRLVDGTFFAEMTLVDAVSNVVTVDARPSDSIAIALRLGTPIFVAREVIAEAGALSDPESESVEDPSAEVGDASASVEAEAESEADDPPSSIAEEQGPAVLVDGEGVRLEDLEADFFGKYKM